MTDLPPSTDPRPDDETQTVAYTPTPEHRPEWAAPPYPATAYAGYQPVAPAQPTMPFQAAESGPAGSAVEPVQHLQPVQPVSPIGGQGCGGPHGGGRQGGVGPGSIVAAALLSAVLASGGTALVLTNTGALRGNAGAAASQAPVTATQGPVSVDDGSAVVNAAAKVSPAVVRIIAEGVSTDVFGGAIPETGVGSGIIYDASGWILTNRHVVRTQDGAIASKLTVELKDGREFTGTVYGIDTLTDLAIVKVDAADLPAAPIGRSADIKVGQLAIAIGSPLGTYTSTVTTGIISATGRSVLVEAKTRLSNLIQTDAAINPGNSGGPLLDATGAVIGINTAVERDSTGIGFAIPIDIARPVMRQALAGEQLARPYVGIRYVAVDAKVKAAEKLSVDHGALIGPSTDEAGVIVPAITPGSPGEAAGLKDGDIILSIEGQAIDSEHPLDALMTSYAPGQSIKLRVLRGSDELDVSVTLGTRPEGL
ncbi:MAG TPA: trypsin-like peptidase domain-containing protein [Candidatus Limnocylindria bacterium]|nr:trypsin-like peptidase domain-containing protein [Candidatus Limnocylindria bacterium]